MKPDDIPIDVWDALDRIEEARRLTQKLRTERDQATADYDQRIALIDEATTSDETLVTQWADTVRDGSKTVETPTHTVYYRRRPPSINTDNADTTQLAGIDSSLVAARYTVDKRAVKKKVADGGLNVTPSGQVVTTDGEPLPGVVWHQPDEETATIKPVQEGR